MLFDVNLLFYHTGNAYTFSSGEYVNLSGATATSTTLISSVIDLAVARDLGRGSGEAVPKLALVVGTGITSACTSLTINAQFQGSTDSTNWTTYIESGALSTASFAAGQYILPQDVPRVPSGVSLPRYYRINLVTAGLSTNTISSGTLIGGIVIDRAENDSGYYPSGFTAA